jgi:hypothetical protein
MSMSLIGTQPRRAVGKTVYAEWTLPDRSIALTDTEA